MLHRSLRRGLAAGLVAGVLAGLFGLVVGEPSLDAAIAREEAAEERGHEPGETFSRPAQKAGLVAGSALAGAAVGLIFGLAAAWAGGRLDGDAWSRSMRLGAVGVAVFVALPALVVPANPPGVGDPGTVGTRTGAYLLTIVVGLCTAVGLRTWLRRRREQGWTPPARWTVAGGVGALVVAALLVTRPDLPTAPADLPAGLLWRFRLAALVTQALLVGGTAVVFGLLARAGRGASAPVGAP